MIVPQTYTLIDFFKLSTPGIVTGIVVIIAAWITYRFANQGRKEDILYKEQYKSFEIVAGYLFEILRFVEDSDIYYLSKIKGVSTGRLIISKIKNDLVKIKKEEPNRRHLVLLSKETKKSYYEVIKKMENLLLKVDFSIFVEDENGKEYTEEHSKDAVEISKMVEELNDQANKCQDLAFKDLNLPRG